MMIGQALYCSGMYARKSGRGDTFLEAMRAGNMGAYLLGQEFISCHFFGRLVMIYPISYLRVKHKRFAGLTMYFVSSFICIWGSGYLGTQLAVFFKPSVGLGNLAGESLCFLNIFFSCIFSSVVETAILVYCICISRQIFKDPWVAIFSLLFQ